MSHRHYDREYDHKSSNHVSLSPNINNITFAYIFVLIIFYYITLYLLPCTGANSVLKQWSNTTVIIGKDYPPADSSTVNVLEY